MIHRIYPTIVAGTATGIRLSTANSYAFLDNCPANILKYVDHYLELRDASNRIVGGWIKAVGVSETTENIWSDNCADDGLADWLKANCTAAFDTDHYMITYVSASQYLYKSVIIGVGKLLKASADIANGTLSGVTFGLQINQGLGSNITTFLTQVSGAEYATMSGYRTAGAQTYVAVNTAMGGAGNVRVKNIAFSQVLTPSISGVTITSTKGGTALNAWTTQDASFTYNAASYAYRIMARYKLSGNGGFVE